MNQTLAKTPPLPAVEASEWLPIPLWSLRSAMVAIAHNLPDQFPHKAMGNVHLKLTGESLCLTRFDPSVLYQLTIPCAAYEGIWEGNVPMQIFRDLLNRLPVDQDWFFKWNGFHLEFANHPEHPTSRYMLCGLDSDLKIPDLKPLCAVELRRNDVEAIANHVIPVAIQKQTWRTELTGVSLRLGQGVDQVVATDGHRLAHLHIDPKSVSVPDERGMEVLIPFQFWKALARFTIPDSLRFYFNAHYVWVDTGTVRLVAELLTDEYSNKAHDLVHSAIPWQATVNRKRLRQAIYLMKVLSKEERRSRWHPILVKADAGSQLLILRAGDTIEVIPAQVTATSRARINPHYLEEAIKHLNGDDLRLSLECCDRVFAQAVGQNLTRLIAPSDVPLSQQFVFIPNGDDRKKLEERQREQRRNIIYREKQYLPALRHLDGAAITECTIAGVTVPPPPIPITRAEVKPQREVIPTPTVIQDPKPKTQNSKPKTQNSKPKTPTPKPAPQPAPSSGHVPTKKTTSKPKGKAKSGQRRKAPAKIKLTVHIGPQSVGFSCIKGVWDIDNPPPAWVDRLRERLEFFEPDRGWLEIDPAELKSWRKAA